ncbi:MAG: hypothetical protein Tp1111DCM1126091_94 [Prokaryotic dsDNA virus sp.]|nr:MAG: hypothetical protein Tp1111DCM1126091_94 [Prokaryotic dsDNA virus sp.]|tara:strand:- start:53213 stop:53680 length:468 start_codon:yes stop_codon:yes gene_type:complete
MPADFTTENGKVRFNIGDIEEPYILSDVVIDGLLAKYTEESEEYRIWKATIDALYILKGIAAKNSERRREREGSVEVEVYSNLTYDSISDLLDYYKSNPPMPAAYGYDLHIFGGVSKDEKSRVKNDPDSARPYPEVDGTYEQEPRYIPEEFEGLY